MSTLWRPPRSRTRLPRRARTPAPGAGPWGPGRPASGRHVARRQWPHVPMSPCPPRPRVLCPSRGAVSGGFPGVRPWDSGRGSRLLPRALVGGGAGAGLGPFSNSFNGNRIWGVVKCMSVACPLSRVPHRHPRCVRFIDRWL